MNHHDMSLTEIKKLWHGNLRSYLIGFILCFILSCTAFFLATTNSFSRDTLIYSVISLAILQFIAQSIYFLHVGQEEKPQWESLVFYFMIMVLLIVAVGSLWIMNDLSERVMSHMEMPHD
jgi:cytochrome o ubiquinol oxidase subunit IV